MGDGIGAPDIFFEAPLFFSENQILPDAWKISRRKLYMNIKSAITIVLVGLAFMSGPLRVDATPGGPFLSINDAGVTEGDSGSTNAVFTVALSQTSLVNVQVDYSTSNGTAKAGGDFDAVGGSVIILAGDLTTNITVAVHGDVLNEASPDTFFVNLTSPVNASILDEQGLGSITDDDVEPSLSIGNVSVTEGSSGTTTAVFTITMSEASGQDVVFTYATSNSSALSPGDYIAATGSITILEGDTETNLSVTVNSDTLDEAATESFLVRIINATHATISDGVGQCSISDDDASPTLSISDAAVQEGDAGVTGMLFTVTLSAASGFNVPFTAISSNGTAMVIDGDYNVYSNNTLSIPAGQTSTSLTISVNGDILDEDSPETLYVNLMGATNATLADAQGRGDINDDDASPTISIDDVSYIEGNSGLTSAVFTVTLSAASGRPVQFNYGTSNGTAAAGVDYTPTIGTLTFATGQVSKLVVVSVMGDLLDEASPESFYLNLTSTNATFQDSEGRGDITDDDDTPTLSIEGAVLSEGNSGTNMMSFALNLTAASGLPVQFSIGTSNGTASAAAGDFIATNRVITIPSGLSATNFYVSELGDVLDEASPEQFYVIISSLTNAILSESQGIGVGSISNDDVAPSLSIGDVTLTEGDAGSTQALFAVSLSAASGQDIQLHYTSSNGTAAAASDYTAINGSLLIPSGATSSNIIVTILGDLLDEASPETLFVTLSSPSNATLADAQGQGNVTDDDEAPDVNIFAGWYGTPAGPAVNGTGMYGDYVMEGNSGSTSEIFTVTLSAPSGQGVQFWYQTSNGTATAGADYGDTNNAITIPPGQTSSLVTVWVHGDTVNEAATDTFFVAVTAVSNGLLSGGSIAQGSVIDDDEVPSLSIANATTIDEADLGATGTVSAVFTVSLSAVSGRPVQFDFGTSNGLAVSGGDYVATNNTITIPAGETETNIYVSVNGDLLDEASPECFFVNIGNASNATVFAAKGRVDITDDDDPPTITINDVSHDEGDPVDNKTSDYWDFNVILSAASGLPVQFCFATSNGSAIADTDYEAVNDFVTIAEGETNVTLCVHVLPDLLDEVSPETFYVNLKSPSNATLADDQGEGAIVDDDATPSLSISDVNITEDNGDSVDAVFVVTLSAVSGQDVQFHVATGDGSAKFSKGDYDPINQTVLLPSGQSTTNITVSVNGDLLDELGETFFVGINNPSNSTVNDGQGVCNISDNDDPPDLLVADATITEGDVGVTSLVFSASLSEPSGLNVLLTLSTTSGTATAGSDYVSTNRNFSIPAGQTNVTLTVGVKGDVLDENSPEFFFVKASSVQNASIDDGTGNGFILDNDASPSLSIGDVTVTEGDVGLVEAEFTVSLSAISGRLVLFDIATSEGTATLLGGDYLSNSDTLSIQPGETNVSFVVQIVGDERDENSPEDFFVDLSNPLNALLDVSQAEGNIEDNDPLPSLSVDDLSILEGDDGSQTVSFTATVTPVSGRVIDFTMDTTNGTALDGIDYSSHSQHIIVPPGNTTASISVDVTGDEQYEPSHEAFYVNMGNANNATVLDGLGQCDIADNDDPADTDNDDMPDSWETTYFGGIDAEDGGPYEDYDGDGIPNIEEFIIGSDPTADNRGLIVDYIGKTNGVVGFAINTVTGRVYDVDSGTSILTPNWQNYTSFWGNGGAMTITNLNPNYYYRFHVRMQNP
jgi:hypothetical protein